MAIHKQKPTKSFWFSFGKWLMTIGLFVVIISIIVALLTVDYNAYWRYFFFIGEGCCVTSSMILLSLPLFKEDKK